MKLSSQIKPISYLKIHAAEIVPNLSGQAEPLVITQNGDAKVVMQDIESYEQTQETSFSVAATSAMSMWAHGKSLAKWARNSAALEAPAFIPPAASPAARIWSTTAAGHVVLHHGVDHRAGLDGEAAGVAGESLPEWYRAHMSSVTLTRTERKRPRQTRWAVVLVAALGVIASGCSSDAANSSAEKATDTAIDTVEVNTGVVAAGSTVNITVHNDRPGRPVNKALVGSNEPIEYPDAVKDASDPLMRELDPDYIRTFAHFDLVVDDKPYYDCATGTWDPAPFDRELAHIRAQGAKALIVVGRAPSCLTGQLTQDSWTPQPSPLAIDGGVRWNALVRDMAIHAIRSGVRAFEVWNEPDLSLSGLPTSYLDLYDTTARVLERAAADEGVDIDVGGPATVLPGTALIESLLDYVSANDLPLDFISWHWYGNIACAAPCAGMRTQIYGEQIAAVKAVLARYPGLDPELWITEWNTTFTVDSYFSVSPYGAAYLTSALDAMQQGGLDRSMFFLTAGGDTGTLIQKDGTEPGPQYRAMANWAAQAETQTEVSVSPDQTSADPTGRVGVIAATGPEPRSTVLLYNFAPFDPAGNDGRSEPTSFPHQIVLRLEGLQPGEYTWALSLTDNAHAAEIVDSGTVDGPSAELKFTLSQNAVSLLTLCRAGEPPRCT